MNTPMWSHYDDTKGSVAKETWKHEKLHVLRAPQTPDMICVVDVNVRNGIKRAVWLLEIVHIYSCQAAYTQSFKEIPLRLIRVLAY